MLPNIIKSLLQPQSKTPAYCRVCLQANKDLHQLDDCLKFGFDVNSVEKLSLQHLLKEVSGCEGNSIGPISGVCELCLDDLITAFLFRKRCRNADQTIGHVSDWLEKIVKNAEAAAPTTTVLAKVSLITNGKANDVYLRNYESHQNNSSSLRFINEIFEPEISMHECASPNSGSDYPAAEDVKPSGTREKSKNKPLAFQCKICGKCFLYVSTLKHHLHYHGERTHKCNVCPKLFKTSNDLRKHLKRHALKEMFGCELCDLNLNSRSALHEHRKLVHGLEKNVYPCNVCGFILSTKLAFRKHLRTHNLDVERNKSSKKERSFQCNACGKVLSTKYSLKVHSMRHCTVSMGSSDNKKKKKVLCPLCGKLVTAFPALLKAHMDTHGDRKYPCEDCNKKFKTKSGLNAHRRTRHLSIPCNNPCICDHCGVTRRTKSKLAAHMIIHEPKGHYQCNVCDKVFAREGYLKYHKLTHLNIRPEHCNICDGRFVNKQALLYHQRLHTGERPYLCEICGDKFVSQSRKKAHIVRKHMEKRVSCNICGSLFYTQPEVNSHVKVVHLKIPRKRNVVPTKSIKADSNSHSPSQSD